METAIIEQPQNQVDKRSVSWFKPGQSGNPGGLPKGIQHKSVKIKQAFFEAFDRIGGMEALATWAQSHKTVFYKLVVPLLPKELSVDATFTQKKIIIELGPKDKDSADSSRDSHVKALSEAILSEQ